MNEEFDGLLPLLNGEIGSIIADPNAMPFDVPFLVQQTKTGTLLRAHVARLWKSREDFVARLSSGIPITVHFRIGGEYLDPDVIQPAAGQQHAPTTIMISCGVVGNATLLHISSNEALTYLGDLHQSLLQRRGESSSFSVDSLHGEYLKRNLSEIVHLAVYSTQTYISQRMVLRHLSVNVRKDIISRLRLKGGFIAARQAALIEFGLHDS